jgi:hypothetical protein
MRMRRIQGLGPVHWVGIKMQTFNSPTTGTKARAVLDESFLLFARVLATERSS